MTPVAALVLAGSRGPADPMAAAAGVSHKALIPVGGVPMLARVLSALQASPAVGRIAICIEDMAALDSLPGLRAEIADGRILLVPAASGPSASVARALQLLGTPLMVTAADHALLRPEWVDHFLAAIPAGKDVVAAVARAEAVRAAAPGTRRTFLRFADGALSGCNLFYLATPAAAAAVRFWQRVEAHRKRPLKLMRMLGPAAMLRFVLGRLTLAAALERLGRLAGAEPGVVVLPFGAAAIDVDTPADLALVERLVRLGQG